MKILIAGNKSEMKDIVFAFKYENIIREIIVFISKQELQENPFFSNYTCIHTKDELNDYFKESPFFLIVESNPEIKQNIYNDLKELGGYPFTYISCKSLVSKLSSISNHGVSIQLDCNISSGIEISEGVQIGLQSMIGHDVKIGAFTSIGNKCSILGYVEIGSNCQIGHGVTIMPNVKIMDNVKIGNCQLVRKDIASNNELL